MTIVATCCQLRSTKVDFQRDKLATVVGRIKLTILAAVDAWSQFITLSVHLSVQHDVLEAARRAGPSATADTCCMSRQLYSIEYRYTKIEQIKYTCSLFFFKSVLKLRESASQNQLEVHSHSNLLGLCALTTSHPALGDVSQLHHVSWYGRSIISRSCLQLPLHACSHSLTCTCTWVSADLRRRMSEIWTKFNFWTKVSFTVFYDAINQNGGRRSGQILEVVENGIGYKPIYMVGQKTGPPTHDHNSVNPNRLRNFFTRTFSGKFAVKRIAKIPPHLKCVATLPCNLSLMACFADINVS